MAITALGSAKLAMFVKNNWKPVIVIILSLMVTAIILPVIIISSLFPAAEPSIVDIYKKTAVEAGINWKELIVVDTIRYKNKFEGVCEADIVKTALDFYEVGLRRYEQVKVEVPTTENPENEVETTEESTKVEYEWRFKSDTRYTGRKNIMRMFNKIGYKEYYNSFKKVKDAFKDINSSEEYQLRYEILPFSKLIKDFSEENKKWAYELMDSNLEELFE